MPRTRQPATSPGFSLLEMLIAVSLFSIVAVLAVGSLTSLMDANRKARSQKSVTDNIHAVIETITRDMRGGRNTSVSGSSLSFTDASGDAVVFQKSCNADGCYVERSVNGTAMRATAPNVEIESLTFTELSQVGGQQPGVIVAVRGTAGEGADATSFNIETILSERTLDYETRDITTVAVPTVVSLVNAIATLPAGAGTPPYLVDANCESPVVTGSEVSRLKFDLISSGQTPDTWRSPVTQAAVWGGAATIVGKWCNALSFDGVNDYVRMANDDGRMSNMWRGDGDAATPDGMTVVAWVRPTGYGSAVTSGRTANKCSFWTPGWLVGAGPERVSDCNTGFIVNTDDSGSPDGWIFAFTESRRLTFGVDSGTAHALKRYSHVGDVMVGPTAPWQQVAVTWTTNGFLTSPATASNAANVKLYINGTETSYDYSQNATFINSTNAANAATYLYGSDAADAPEVGSIHDIFYWPYGGSRFPGDFPEFFEGAIDDVRVYKRPLSSAEIYSIYDYTESMYSLSPTCSTGQVLCGARCMPDTAGLECCNGKGVNTEAWYCPVTQTCSKTIVGKCMPAGAQCAPDGQCFTGGGTAPQQVGQDINSQEF